MKRLLCIGILCLSACSPLSERDIAGRYRYDRSDQSERVEILSSGYFRHHLPNHKIKDGTWRLVQNEASECLAIEMPAFTVTNGGMADNGARAFSGCVYKTIFGQVLIEVSTNEQTYLSRER